MRDKVAIRLGDGSVKSRLQMRCEELDHEDAGGHVTFEDIHGELGDAKYAHRTKLAITEGGRVIVVATRDPGPQRVLVYEDRVDRDLINDRRIAKGPLKLTMNPFKGLTPESFKGRRTISYSRALCD